MNNWNKTILITAVAAAWICAAGTGWAQMGAADGHANLASNINANITWSPNHPNPFFIGYSGTNNSMTIGPDGYWSSGGWHSFSLGGGLGGNHNTFIIQTGGVYRTGSGVQRNYIGGANEVSDTGAGEDITGGAYNRLLIQGGSFTNVGSQGMFVSSTGNLVRVSDGGDMMLGNYLRLGNQAGSLSNRLEVSGAGSSVTITNLFYIGNHATATRNVAEVSAGGTLEVGNRMDVGNSGTQNRLEVTGADSEVTVGGTLHVGLAATAHENRVVVSDEGVLTANRVDVGYRGDDNLFEVKGTGSRLTVAGDMNFAMFEGSGNVMEISEGGILEAMNGLVRIGVGISDDAYENVLRISNGGTGTVHNLQPGAHHYRNRLEVTGEGSLMTVTNIMLIGANAGSYENAAAISHGGTLEVGAELRVGNSATAYSNVLSFTDGGVGSINELSMGHSGTENRMEVSGGNSEVTVDGTMYVGYNSGANENRVLVGDGGSLAANRLDVGHSGANNHLEVSGGNSEVTVGGTMYLGLNTASHENRVVVTNGGAVSANRLDVGYQGNDNRFEVTGAGSTLTVGGDLIYFGTHRGSGNVLEISDGGGLLAGNATAQLGVGVSAAAHDNRLRVIDGGTGTVNAVNMGWHYNNYLDVIGSGSRLAVNQSVRAGYLGSSYGNVVEVKENGALAVGVNLIAGDTAGTHSNEIHVASGGYVSAGGAVSVGESGSHNLMLVEEGGLVRSANANIGLNAGSTHNEVKITGAGSAWTNTGTFFVSAGGGDGNLLQVHDGALLESGTLRVGTGGTLELDGATLSLTGSGNALQVSTGGLLRGTGILQGDAFQQPELLIQGEVSPGFSTGTLTIRDGDLTFGEDAVVRMEIAAGGDFDQIVLEKTEPLLDLKLTLNGTLQLSLLGSYEPQLHDSFQLFSADSYLDLGMAIDDSDAQLPEGWMSWQLNEDGSVSVIPEAATTGTMLLGLAFIFGYRRRRMRA